MNLKCAVTSHLLATNELMIQQTTPPVMDMDYCTGQQSNHLYGWTRPSSLKRGWSTALMFVRVPKYTAVMLSVAGIKYRSPIGLIIPLYTSDILNLTGPWSPSASSLLYPELYGYPFIKDITRFVNSHDGYSTDAFANNRYNSASPVVLQVHPRPYEVVAGLLIPYFLDLTFSLWTEGSSHNVEILKVPKSPDAWPAPYAFAQPTFYPWLWAPYSMDLGNVANGPGSEDFISFMRILAMDISNSSIRRSTRFQQWSILQDATPQVGWFVPNSDAMHPEISTRPVTAVSSFMTASNSDTYRDINIDEVGYSLINTYSFFDHMGLS